jgi:heat shock protein HslJ
MRRQGLYAGLLLAGLMLATGCGDEAGAGGSDGLRGRTFLSTAVTEDGRAKTLAGDTRISLWFAEDGRLVANAGCNTMQSPVDTGDGRLGVEDLATTEMGCDAARHAQDEWFAKVLTAKPSWRLSADTLTLESGGTTVTLLDKKAVQPDLPLTGTRWTLDTIIQGEVASSTAGSSKAYVVFDDGQVQGSTGCNSMGGTATVSGGTVTFGSIGATRKACDGPANDVERAVLAVLDGAVSAAVDGNRLTLKHPSGRALVLTG